MCAAATRCHKVTLGNDTMPQRVLFHLIKYTAHCASIISSRDQILNSQRGVNASLWINFWLQSKGNLFVNERDRKSSIRLRWASQVILKAQFPPCSQRFKESNLKRLWTRCVTDSAVWVNLTTITRGWFDPSAPVAHGAPFGRTLQDLELRLAELRRENSPSSMFTVRQPTLRKCSAVWSSHSTTLEVATAFHKQKSSSYRQTCFNHFWLHKLPEHRKSTW